MTVVTVDLSSNSALDTYFTLYFQNFGEMIYKLSTYLRLKRPVGTS